MKKLHSENPDNPFFFEKQLTKFYSNPLIDQFFSVLINSIGGKDFLVLVVGESQSGKTSLLSRLTSQIEKDVKPCHLKIREKDEPTSKDNKHPAFLYKTPNCQVIILDDAHKLNAQELSIILKNAWDNEKKISQLILFCESRINTILSSLLKEMPKKTSVNKLYIPSFDKQQTEEYLNHCLEALNLIDHFTFSKLNINNIYKKSKGLPGKINLEAGEIYSKKRVHLKTKKHSRSLFSPAFTFILLILLFSSITGFALYKKNNILSLFSSNKIISEPSHKTVTKKILPTMKKQALEQQLIIKQKINREIIARSTITETNIPISKPVIKKKSEEEISILATEKPVILQKNWIMIQEPQLYTIQVMAAKENDSIERFLKLNINNKNEIAYYKMYSKDGTWYKFISGKFKTLEKAKEASHDLPKKLQKLGPWPRQFASIQNDINIGTLIKNNKDN